MSEGSKGLIIITGASSGIGEACARAFSAAGHPLLLLARRIERMESLGLPNCMCRKVDVTDVDAFSAAIAEAEAAHGPAECLVNNAGVMLLGSIPDQDPAEWATMLSVNVTGVLNGMRAVLGGMVGRKRGTIINVSSIAGIKVLAGWVAGDQRSPAALSRRLPLAGFPEARRLLRHQVRGARAHGDGAAGVRGGVRPLHHRGPGRGRD